MNKKGFSNTFWISNDWFKINGYDFSFEPNSDYSGSTDWDDAGCERREFGGGSSFIF